MLDLFFFLFPLTDSICQSSKIIAATLYCGSPVPAPLVLCTCPDVQVKLPDVEGGRTEKQHKSTWRTFSPRDCRHSGLSSSLRLGPAAVLVLCALSELLVCCGHPQ